MKGWKLELDFTLNTTTKAYNNTNMMLTYLYSDLYDPAKNGECLYFIEDGELGLGLLLCFKLVSRNFFFFFF